MEEVYTQRNTPTKTQICYGPPNNNTNSTKNKTSSNPNNNGQNKVTVLKRDSAANQRKENNSDIQCMLCNQLIAVLTQEKLEIKDVGLGMRKQCVKTTF